MIVSLPALESLRAEYTEVWCPSVVAPLMRFAHSVVSISGSGVDRVGIIDARDVLLRLQDFDEIHSWYGSTRHDFRNACSDLPIQFYPSLPSQSDRHAVDFYLSQVSQPLGGSPHIPMINKTRDLFAILHPFSGSARKNWPLEQWRELEKLLQLRMPVYWCAGPEDQLPGAVVIPDLYQLAEWISRAHVFIGNDSGITHLAAATGTPTVALFGPTNPSVWAPRGTDVTVIHREPIGDIAAQEVAEAVR